METINLLKNTIVTICSLLVAYFAPISNVVFVIFYVFLVNFLAGLISGIVAQEESFSLKKFFYCVLETMVYYVIVLSVFTVGDKMGNVGDAMQCISGVTYAIIYFYTVNIMRNLQILFPGNMTIRFLYYIVSFEVVKKIPFLQNFLKKEDKKESL